LAKLSVSYAPLRERQPWQATIYRDGVHRALAAAGPSVWSTCDFRNLDGDRLPRVGDARAASPPASFVGRLRRFSGEDEIGRPGPVDSSSARPALSEGRTSSDSSRACASVGQTRALCGSVNRPTTAPASPRFHLQLSGGVRRVARTSNWLRFAHRRLPCLRARSSYFPRRRRARGARHAAATAYCSWSKKKKKCVL